MCPTCKDLLSTTDDWFVEQDDWNEYLFCNYLTLETPDGYNALNDNYKINKCICGVNIKKMYVIKNDKRQVFVVLGAECIKSYKYKLFKDDHVVVKFVENSKKYYCNLCDKTMASTSKKTHIESNKHLELVNYEAKKKKAKEALNKLKSKFRKCKYCNDYNIEAKSKQSITACSECAKTYVFWTKKCNKCKCGMSKHNYDTYKGTCYKCSDIKINMQFI